MITEHFVAISCLLNRNTVCHTCSSGKSTKQTQKQKLSAQTNVKVFCQYKSCVAEGAFSCLPEWISLAGEQTEVLLGQLNRRQRLNLQVGPRADKHHQAFEGVQAQAVVAVVGEVGHENAYL